MRKYYLSLAVFILIMLANQVKAQHFQTVWSGNPYQVMNFIINSTTIDGVNIEAGDEIAVFDLDGSGNEICVGALVFTAPPSQSNPAMLNAASDDPTTQPVDGFTSGNSIIYRLWDNSEQTEIITFDATYNTTPPFVDVYISFGSALVDVDFFSALKTTASSVTTCPGLVTVPITVDNFMDVTEFSIVLDYNETHLIYNSYQNLNTQLAGGTFNLVNTGSEIEVTWNSATAVTLNDATIFELIYDAQIFYTQTLSNLSWVNADCYFIDVNSDTITKQMIDGIVTLEAVPGDAGSISGPASVCQGSSESFSVAAISNASTYSWELNPAGAGTINGTGSSITINWSASFNGQAVLSVYGSNACGSGTPSSLSVTVTPNPTVDAGSDDNICENGSYQLQGTAADYASLQWTTSGDGTFSTPNALTPLYNPGTQDASNGSAVLSLTANPLSPCANPVSDNMILSLSPLPLVSAGADATICENSTHSLSGTASNYSSVLWTTAGDGTFSNATTINPVYTPGANDISSGTVNLTLTAEALLPCTANVNDALSLTVVQEPTADAGSDDAACENAPYTLSGAANNYSSLLWSTSGDGTFDDASILNATYTPGAGDLNNGSVVLSLTAEPLAPCSQAASDDLTLNVYISPVADAGPNAVICENETYTLNGAASDYSSVLWTTAGDGSFSDATILNPVYTPGANDLINGSVDLSLTSYAIAPCTYDDTDQMTITIQDFPEGYAGADDDVCNEDPSYTLNPTVTSASSVLWTTNGDGSFDDPNIENATYTAGPNDIANGSVLLSINANPVAPCANPASDDVLLNITPSPVANAGPDDTICENSSTYAITGAGTQNASSFFWSTTGDGTFDDVNMINANYTPGLIDISSGSVELILTANAIAPCSTPDADTMLLVFAPLPLVDAGNDTQTCENSTVQLSGSASWQSSLLWSTSGDGTFDDTSILNPIYTPGANDIASGTTDLTLTAEASIPCSGNVSSTLTLTIIHEPTANAGPDDAACENAPYTLNGTATDYSSVQWNTSGNGTFDDASLLNATYTPGSADLANGVVELWITAEPVLPCSQSVSDTLILNVYISPTADAGADAVICENEVHVLNGSASNNTSVLWTTAGDGSFDDDGSLTPVYTPGANDIINGSVDLTLTSYAIPPCTYDDTDQVTIQIQSFPAVFAGADDNVCNEDPAYSLNPTVTAASSVLWSTSGDGAFDDQSNENAIYTPGANDILNGSVLLTITADPVAPCADNATDDLLLNIIPSAIANAGANDTICENSAAYYLSEASAGNNSNILWSTAGDGTFDDASLLNATYYPGANDLLNGSALLTLTANPIAPCSNPATDEILLTIAPLPLANAGNDGAVCENSAIQLSGTAENYSSLLWMTSGDGVFDDPSFLNPVYNPGISDATNGTVDITLTAYADLPCTNNVTDIITLSVLRLPVADAGADITACEDSPAISLSGSATDYDHVIWTTAGDGSFDDNSLLNPVYTAGAQDIANGQVELEFTAYPLSPCEGPVSDFIMIDFQDAPSADAGANAMICENETYMLNGSPANNSSVLWTTSGDGTFDDAGSLTAVYTPGGTDITSGSVSITLTAHAIAPCANDATDQMTISIQELPEVYAGIDDSTCMDNPDYTLSASGSDYSTVLWTSSGDGTFNDPSILNPVYSPGANDLSLGEVMLSVSVDPVAPCGNTASDNMILSFTPYPIANAGINDTICMNTPSYSISGASVQNQSSLQWTTSGDGTFDDPAILNATYTPGSSDINNGSVYLILSANSLVCNTSDIDSLLLTFSVLPVSDAGADDLICETDTHTLSGTADFYSSIQWTTSGDGTFDDPNILNPVYTPGANDIISGDAYLTLNAYPVDPCTDVISDEMYLEIQGLPVADAPANDTICMSTPEYAISGATVGNQDAILWTTSGDGSFSDPSILNPVYYPGSNDIDNGSVVLSLTASAVSPCAIDSTDSMTLVFALLPTANAGPDDSGCEAEGYQLNGSAENYSSVWWYSSGDGSFDDPNILNPVYTPGEADGSNGEVTLILFAYSIQPCSTEEQDTLILQINPLPEAEAGDDAFICEDESYMLEGSSSGYGSVLWTTSGDGTFDDNSILNATYTPGANDIANGMAELTLTAYQSSPCNGSAEDMMQLTIDLLPGTPETPSGPELVDIHTTSSTQYSIQEATNADEYVWELIPEGAGSISASGINCSITWNDPPVNDTAYLSVVAINDCDSSYSQALTILTYTSVGIGENHRNPAVVNIVPNPTSGQFQLILIGVEEDVNIELIRGNGRVISKENMINLSKERSVKDFDLSNQPKGVYYLRIYNNGLNVVRKVIVQ